MNGPTSPDVVRAGAGLQAPYATESPETVKGYARRRQSYHEHYESRTVHNVTAPMTGSESLASLATQAPQGVIAPPGTLEPFSGRKSVESEPTTASARQEKVSAPRRHQQPRQAHVQRRRSQPMDPNQGYQDEEKVKPVVVVGEKGISKVEDYGKAGLYRARSVLPTLAERNPLSDLQAGYAAAPVLLGHPMNRSERPWEPKCDLDCKTQVPESIFKAMEKLGHAARHRGQHILAKSSRHRGRKTLIRHDCIPGRQPTDERSNTSGGWEVRPDSRQNGKVASTTGEVRNRPAPPVPASSWRSVLGIAPSKEALLRSF